MAEEDPEQLDMSLEALIRQDDAKPQGASDHDGGGTSSLHRPQERSPNRGRFGGGRRGHGFRRGGHEGNWNPGWGNPRRGPWNEPSFGRDECGREFWGGGFRGNQPRGGMFRGRGGRAGGMRGQGWGGRGVGMGMGMGMGTGVGVGMGEPRREFVEVPELRGRGAERQGSWNMKNNVDENGFDPKNYENCSMDMEGGDVVVTHRGTEIIKVRPSGDIALDSGGNRTLSMLKAFNDVLNLVSVQLLAHDNAPEEWSVKDGRTLMRFYDGLVLKAKGDLHQTRGQTILQAFSHPNRKAAVEATMASTLMAQSMGLLPGNDPACRLPGPSGSVPLNEKHPPEVKNEWNEWQRPHPGHFHPHHPNEHGFPRRDGMHPRGFGNEALDFQHPEPYGPGPFKPYGHMGNWPGKMGGPDLGFMNGMGEPHFNEWNGYMHPVGFEGPYGMEREVRPYSSDAKIRRKMRQGRYQPY